MTIEGIDVSRWQATTPSLVGKSFLFARATYGTFTDAMYATHIINARAAGLVAGAYHFGRAGNVPGQVAAFLARAGDADLFCLDLESDGASSMSLGEAQAFIVAVHASGRKIGLYHSDSGFAHIGQDWDWVANWSQVPARPWTFWQYGGSGVDRDKFNGTLAQLQALVHPAIPKTWTAHVPAGGAYTSYKVVKVNGTWKIIDHHNWRTPHGFTLPCTGPYPVRRGTIPETRVQLVKITKPGASYDGIWIAAGFARTT
jgi:hypothetical protein